MISFTSSPGIDAFMSFAGTVMRPPSALEVFCRFRWGSERKANSAGTCLPNEIGPFPISTRYSEAKPGLDECIALLSSFDSKHNRKARITLRCGHPRKIASFY